MASPEGLEVVLLLNHGATDDQIEQAAPARRLPALAVDLC